MTIACVYNDAAVRRHCLDRSIEAYDGPVEVEYLPVDNTEHAHTSAGAALNHAVRQASHDVVVLVHQDVYLHDLDRLAACAAALEDERWGILGANGVTADHTSVGRLRDRVILIGESAPDPVPVDTLDEVLLIARRDDLLREPLSEEPELAWHAYAVEYSLRVRAAGRLAGAVDTAITHNSMSTNLARLDEAHRHVGDLYPALVPIHTTCGTVDPGARDWGRLPLIRDHGWRRRWLQQSRIAARVRSEIGVQVVLADIAHEVDLLGYSREQPLHLLNADRRRRLRRRGRCVRRPRARRPAGGDVRRRAATRARLPEVARPGRARPGHRARGVRPRRPRSGGQWPRLARRRAVGRGLAGARTVRPTAAGGVVPAAGRPARREPATQLRTSVDRRSARRGVRDGHRDGVLVAVGQRHVDRPGSPALGEHADVTAEAHAGRAVGVPADLDRAPREGGVAGRAQRLEDRLLRCHPGREVQLRAGSEVQ